MSDTSARLGLPYLAAGQMQKHVTLNEALTRLDGLVQCCVTSRSLVTQPTEPADGALYILPDGAEGAAWSLHPAGSLMRREGGGWIRVTAPAGLIAVIVDTGEIVVRHAADWTPLAAFLGELQNLERLGIGATADAANPFLAKLNSALWTARETGDGGTGDLRLVLNKAGPAEVLSLILQSGWSGRAGPDRRGCLWPEGQRRRLGLDRGDEGRSGDGPGQFSARRDPTRGDGGHRGCQLVPAGVGALDRGDGRGGRRWRRCRWLGGERDRATGRWWRRRRGREPHGLGHRQPAGCAVPDGGGRGCRRYGRRTLSHPVGRGAIARRRGRSGRSARGRGRRSRGDRWRSLVRRLGRFRGRGRRLERSRCHLGGRRRRRGISPAAPGRGRCGRK